MNQNLSTISNRGIYILDFKSLRIFIYYSILDHAVNVAEKFMLLMIMKRKHTIFFIKKLQIVLNSIYIYIYISSL